MFHAVIKQYKAGPLKPWLADSMLSVEILDMRKHLNIF
jgi:hypothetical protein